MLFFFIVEELNRYSIKISKIVARINRVQIFENIFSSDSLHDSNSFISTAFKRVRKRFLNNITVNAINKSTKALKTIKKKIVK